MNALVNKGYVATAQDITTLTKSLFSANNSASTSRQSYLRSLIATSQAALLSKDKNGLMLPTEEAALAALNHTHEEFYPIVLKIAQASTPKKTEDRATVINRRTNFARTAVSCVRIWIKAGNDLGTLDPMTATKAFLTVEPVAPTPTPEGLTSKAEKQSEAILDTLAALRDLDYAAAVAEFQAIIARLSAQFGGGSAQALRPPSRLDGGGIDANH